MAREEPGSTLIANRIDKNFILNILVKELLNNIITQDSNREISPALSYLGTYTRFP